MTGQPSVQRPFGALAIPYSTRGGRQREVLLGVEEDTGVWMLYDIARDNTGMKTGVLVERLTGSGEGLYQALASQGDYARCQRAFAAGEREEFTCPNPLPKPVRVPIRQIAFNAERALRVAFTQAQCDSPLLEQLGTLANDPQSPSSQMLEAAGAA